MEGERDDRREDRAEHANREGEADFEGIPTPERHLVRLEARGGHTRATGISGALFQPPSRGPDDLTDPEVARDLGVVQASLARVRYAAAVRASGMHPLAEKVLAHDQRGTARACRLVDDRVGDWRAILKDLFPHTGRAWTIGVTGNPGAGKSTLTDRLITLLRSRDQKVAVVAVDPTSPFSGGAILGDRIRMQDHAADPEVFIRSLATRGIARWRPLAVGGLDTVQACSTHGAPTSCSSRRSASAKTRASEITRAQAPTRRWW